MATSSCSSLTAAAGCSPSNMSSCVKFVLENAVRSSNGMMSCSNRRGGRRLSQAAARALLGVSAGSSQWRRSDPPATIKPSLLFKGDLGGPSMDATESPQPKLKRSSPRNFSPRAACHDTRYRSRSLRCEKRSGWRSRPSVNSLVAVASSRLSQLLSAPMTTISQAIDPSTNGEVHDA